MALIELDVVRENVIVGFTVVISTFAALTIVFAVRQGPGLLNHAQEKDGDSEAE